MNIQTIITKAIPILKKHAIHKAALFGSVVRGRTTDTSDIDMLIDAPKTMTLFDMAELNADLEDALDRHIDLVEYDAIRPILKASILKYEYPFL